MQGLFNLPDSLLATILAYSDEPLACGSTCQDMRGRLWRDELWATACVVRWGDFSAGAQPHGRFNYGYFRSFRVAFIALSRWSGFEGVYSAVGAIPYGMAVRIELVDERRVRCEAVKDKVACTVFEANVLETGEHRFLPGAVCGLFTTRIDLSCALPGAHCHIERSCVVLRATYIPALGETCYCGGPFGSPHDLNCGCDNSLAAMVKHLFAAETSSLVALRGLELNQVTLLRCSPLHDGKEPRSLLGVFSVAHGSEDGKFGHQFVAVRSVSIRSVSGPFSHAELIGRLRLLDAPNGYLNSYIDAAIVKSPSYDEFGDGESDVSIADLNWLIGTKITGDDDLPMGAVLFIIAFDQQETCRLPSMFSACVRLSNLAWDLGDIVLLSRKSSYGDATWKVAPHHGESSFLIKQSSLDVRRPRQEKYLNKPTTFLDIPSNDLPTNYQPHSGLFDV